MDFKQFLESANPDLDETLHKLPKKVQALLKNYKFKFVGENNLKNDKEHVGLLDPDKNTITVAAPWNYGREMAVLHEVGHLFFNTLKPTQKQQWENIVKKTKEKQEQSPQELFCFAFANYFVHMKVEIHTHLEWEKFIKKLLIAS